MRSHRRHVHFIFRINYITKLWGYSKVRLFILVQLLKYCKQFVLFNFEQKAKVFAYNEKKLLLGGNFHTSL